MGRFTSGNLEKEAVESADIFEANCKSNINDLLIRGLDSPPGLCNTETVDVIADGHGLVRFKELSEVVRAHVRKIRECSAKSGFAVMGVDVVLYKFELADRNLRHAHSAAARFGRRNAFFFFT